MINVGVKELLEAGVHFGHQTRRWNPKMKPFIFEARNGIHVIDLSKSLPQLEAACEFLAQTAGKGGQILFVGTKKQAQEAIAEEAARSNQYFIIRRWLGGTLTNFSTIRKRLRHLADLEEQRDRGDLARLTKAEGLKVNEEIEKLNRVFGGVKKMDRLPSALFIVDPHKEELAVKEARKVGIPIVAMVDTNCDPDMIDYVIPTNDDAIRSIRLITDKIAEAAVEGQNRRESSQADQMRGGRYSQPEPDYEQVDESAAEEPVA